MPSSNSRQAKVEKIWMLTEGKMRKVMKRKLEKNSLLSEILDALLLRFSML